MDQAVLDTLNLIPFGALATTNEDGSPHVVPMHFAADDRNLYWFSMADAVHSQNIARGSAVGFAVWTPDRIPSLRGVSIRTVARRIDNEYEIGRGKTVFTMKFPEIPDAFANYDMYTAPIGDVDYDRSGNTWYLNAHVIN
jgi:uncharacterized protein YhbP (UPF0306 family)